MIQVYTGDGKGKTTAALGLAIRAAGAGLKVYIGQFLKGGYYYELATLKKLKKIKVEQFGSGCFIRKAPSRKDKELARCGLEKARRHLKDYDLIILDEINVALKLNLLRLKDVLRFMRAVPKKTELILTGRNAHPEILKLADLISEIKAKKHYFQRGIKARKGIEY